MDRRRHRTWPAPLGQRRLGQRPSADGAGEPTAALCASYAAGVVCCCAAGAHLVVTKLRRGLFSVAPHASDIRTRAGQYQAHHVRIKRAGAPVMTTLSQALQAKLAEVEAIAATEARGEATAHPSRGHPASGHHRADSVSDLLMSTAAARPPAPAPRARLHQVAPRHVPAAGAERPRPGARTRPAHPRFPHGYQLGPAQLVPAAARPRWLAVGRRGPRRMPRRPARRRGDQARRPQPALPWPVRLRRLQGLPRTAEPLPDRRPRARTATPPRRPPPPLPRAPRRRHPGQLTPGTCPSRGLD